MVNRIILNEVSYHGFGAIESIPGEVEKNKFKKAFICTDPGLMELKNLKKVVQIILLQLVEVLLWIVPKL